MLISFSVKNFRSIYEKQELTFLATKYASLSQGLLRDTGVKSGLLPLMAIYGANASGKTNMLKALNLLCNAVVSSHNNWKPEAKILCDPHFFHTEEPTEFECEFMLEKEIYRLGFSLNEDRILHEYLYSRKKLIYKRDGDRYRFGSILKGFETVRKNTRPNALYVSAAAQNNQPLLKKIHAWFASWDTVTEDRSFEEALTGYMVQREEIRSFLSKAIGIISPDVVSIQPDETAKTDDPSAERKLKRRSFSSDHDSWSRIVFTHESKDRKHIAKLALIEESRGTQCYVALARTIFITLMLGRVMLLDEADQSLHPTLLRSIVLLFQSPTTNPRRAQLIFNTHDTTLLTPEVMRPDQVWFADRDAGLNSIFYCLADFKGIRSETQAQRAYLEGRFGAVPFLEEHSRLYAEELNPTPKRPSNEKT